MGDVKGIIDGMSALSFSSYQKRRFLAQQQRKRHKNAVKALKRKVNCVAMKQVLL